MTRTRRLSDQDAQEIAARAVAGREDSTALAKEYGVKVGVVRAIISGSFWHLTNKAAGTTSPRPSKPTKTERMAS